MPGRRRGKNAPDAVASDDADAGIDSILSLPKAARARSAVLLYSYQDAIKL
jgi:hypothetical protein